MKKHFGGRIGALLATALFVLSIGASSVSADSGTIGGKPAKPDPKNPRTSTIFIKTVEPGKSADDSVEVINNSDSEKVVQIYAVDSVRSSGGAFACAQAADPIKDAGGWVKIGATEVKLAAGQKIAVPFTLRVPDSAGVGEHNACIVIQEKKDGTFQSGIGLNFRTAIRVAVLVPGDIVKSIQTTGIAVTPKQTKIDITAKVKSESNVSLDTLVAVNLKPLLHGKGSTQENTFPVLRSEEAEWNFEFNKPFWGGFYKASYTASYNADTTLSLGEPASGGAMKTVNGPSKVVFVWGQPAGVIIEIMTLLLIILALLIIPKRLLDKRKINKKWETHEVVAGETLETIAEQHNIKWKKLAKANKIKAPYVLGVGKLIKVPAVKKNHKTEVEEKPLYAEPQPEEDTIGEIVEEIEDDEDSVDVAEIEKELEEENKQKTPHKKSAKKTKTPKKIKIK